VIGPIGSDVSGGDLEEALALAGFGGSTAERILKGKDKVPTSMFKVTFNSSTLPNFLNLGYQRFQVNPYIAKPWQCFKCQDFGHSAISCKKPPRCVVCSGAHNVKNCTHQGSPLCCNCGGQHTASYGGCSFMKQAKAVERIRVENKVSYREAVKIVKQSANSNMSQFDEVTRSTESTSPSDQPSPSSQQGTWAQRVKPKQFHTPQTATIGTQTQNSTPTLQGLTVTKFIELMSKIIALCTKTDNMDITKVVTDLTKEALQLGSTHPNPTTGSTNSDLPPSPIPMTKTSVRSNTAKESEETESHVIMDTTMNETSIEPSPIIGRNPRKAAQETTKLTGNQKMSESKRKSKTTHHPLPSEKHKVVQSKECLPTKK
jgi:hypothetical protein